MKKKLCFALSFITIVFIVLFFSTFRKKNTNTQVDVVRMVESSETDMNKYLSSNFDSYSIMEKKNSIEFEAIKNIEYSDVSLSSITENDFYETKFQVNYDFDSCIMTLEYTVLNGEDIFDSGTLEGVPFITEDGNTDVVFYEDGEYIYLSSLDINSEYDSCAWWSCFKVFAQKCADAANVIAPVAACCAICVAACAVTVVTYGGGSVALIGASAACSAILTASAAYVTYATVTISAELIAEIGETVDDYFKNKKNNSTLSTPCEANNYLWTNSEVKEVLKEATKEKNEDKRKYCCLFRTQSRIYNYSR